MKVAWLLAMIVVLVASIAWGQQGYVDVGTHPHSDFTDGTLSIDGVAAKFHSTGHQFVVLADHAETINSTEKKPYQLRKEVGVDNWIAQIETRDDLVPGVEVGLGAGRKSHLLYYGGFPADYHDVVSVVEKIGESIPYDALKWLSGFAGGKAEKVDTVLIVAHPLCALYPFTQPLDWVDGVEVFDGISSDPVEELKLIAMMGEAYKRPLTVMTGADFHGAGISRMSEAFGGAVQDLYEPCLERRTFVRASSRDGIVGALKRAECYATFKRARIVSATTWPGGKHNPNEIFKMSCSGLDKALGDKAFVLLVGRGGQSMSADAPLKWKGGTASISLDLKGAPPDIIESGAFLYLSIARQLVTSGIEVLPYSGPRIVSQPEPKPEPTPTPDGDGPNLGGLDLGGFGGDIGVLAGSLLKGLQTGSKPSSAVKVILSVLEWVLVDWKPVTKRSGAPAPEPKERSAAGMPGLSVPTTGGGSGSAQGSQGGFVVPTTPTR